MAIYMVKLSTSTQREKTMYVCEYHFTEPISLYASSIGGALRPIIIHFFFSAPK